jgi:predicted RNA binding protein YcfA (HicA-like mRNA interferase family)
MSLSIEARLGPCEMIGPIGARGMGEVYGARETRLGIALRRQRGSDTVWVRASDWARVVNPVYSGDLKRQTLRGIIADLTISSEEFRGML